MRGPGEKQVFHLSMLLFAFPCQVYLQQSSFQSSTTLLSAGLQYIYPFVRTEFNLLSASAFSCVLSLFNICNAGEIKLNPSQLSSCLLLPLQESPHCKMPTHLLSQEGGSAEFQDKKTESSFHTELISRGGSWLQSHRIPSRTISSEFTAIHMPCKNQHCRCLLLGHGYKTWLFKGRPL